MSSAVPPRRHPARLTQPPQAPSLVDCFQKMSLRRGDTFHNRITVSKENELWDPLECKASPCMPARSSTCPKSIEDLLIGAGERRAAQLLARVDQAIATNSKLALGHILSEPEVWPVPTFLLDDISMHEDVLTKSGARRHSHSHSCDSGLGSSIADSDVLLSKMPRTADGSIASQRQSLSAISALEGGRALSKFASGQIHKHIIKPLLREPALQEFHPLIRDVPERIGNKEIKTLRDLERTLIFLAPEYSPSPSKFLQFCERTIRVLHTTVTTLHDSDQRAPADRPYTQGYFFDLVEQIRRYATILAATREKQAKGEKLDEMDYSPDESVSLLGGVTHNGKPAELVRHKDGKTISLSTGEILPPEDVASASMKRPMDDVDVDHDEALRAMARRKKNAKPESHSCDLCEKKFKRPCDLTKHAKTHERPWKCSDDACKYHEYGWPTEKERDRHVNDKHASTPVLYRCLWEKSGCPYTSKRESNCKQHMEKSHGWQYLRSKNNGKRRATTPHLPRGSVPPSPAGSMLTPSFTPIAPSPSIESWQASRHESMVPPSGVAGPSNYSTPAFAPPSPEFAGHFNFNFSDMPASAWPITPAISDDRQYSTGGSSVHSGLQLDGTSLNDISPHSLSLDGFSDYDFNNNNNFSFAPPPHHVQQITPGSAAANAPSISPGVQLDQIFTSTNYYDAMDMDDEPFHHGLPSGDFTLFGGATAVAGTGDEMIPSLPDGSTWGTLCSQFPTMPHEGTNQALDELFPELKDH